MKNDMNTIILIIFSVKHIIFIITGIIMCKFNTDPTILITFTIIYMIILLVFTFTTKNKIDR